MKKRNKIIGGSFIGIILILSIIAAVGYSNYNKGIEFDTIEQSIQNFIEENNLTEVKSPDPSIKNPLTDVNPRRSFLNASGDEVLSLDHKGSIVGIGNLTFTDSSEGYGFFRYLGDSANKITKGWFTDIFVSGTVNTTYANATIFYEGGNRLLQNIVEDTTPQLGGNLDGQNYNFTTTGIGSFNTVNVDNRTKGYQIDGGFFTGNEGTENIFIGEGTTNGYPITQKSFFGGYHAGFNVNKTGAIGGYAESIADRSVYIGQRAGAGETKLTGTLSPIRYTNVVVGTDTLFTTEVIVGDIIRIKAWLDRGSGREDYEIFEVTAITNDTYLTLDSNYLSSGVGGEGIIERGSNRGAENVGIGALALNQNRDGYENTAIGDDTLRSNVDGMGNAAFGNDALQYNTLGNFNTALGTDTLYENIDGNYNVAVGYQTLHETTTSDYNVGVGYQVLYNNLGGTYNVGLGYQSLIDNVGGDSNIAVGFQALYKNIEGNNNVAIGYKALVNPTDVDANVAIGGYAGENLQHVDGQTGRYNVFIGFEAGQGDTEGKNNTGMYNVGLGFETLKSLTTGQQNLALGFWALRDNENGAQNVAIGTYSLQSSVAGGSNVAIGRAALQYNNGTGSNVAIGTQAGTGVEGTSTFTNMIMIGRDTGKSTTTGFQSVMIGNYAGDAVTSGYWNTMIGYASGGSVNTGHSNTLVGTYAGSSLTSGVRNVFLGFRAGSKQTTLHDKLIIDNRLRGSATNETLKAIIYGVMNANPASQTLKFNADVTISNSLTIGSSPSTNHTLLTVYGNITGSNFIDLTPADLKTGEQALDSIRGITNKDGKIDHDSLSEFVQADIPIFNRVFVETICEDVTEIEPCPEEEDKEKECEITYERCDDIYEKQISGYLEGRNLGNQISELINAFQELDKEVTDMKKELCILGVTKYC